MTVHICGRTNKPKEYINTTSRDRYWGKGLSPFYVGHVDLYAHEGNMLRALNVENACQYSKCYSGHVTDGQPNERYWEWAKKGFADQRANRYPMGKGAVPEFSWWDGKPLSYIEARKKIYAPLYANAVSKTDEFRELRARYNRFGEIWLWDFDSYDYQAEGMTFQDVINCEEKKMGHSFILAMLLENKTVWLEGENNG